MTARVIKFAVYYGVCFAIAIGFAVYAGDFYARRKELAKRLENSLEANVGIVIGGKHGVPFVQRVNQRVLAVLEEATVGTLSEPRPAGAMELDNPRHLVVYWIEAKPSIDSIEVVSESGKSLATLPIPDLYQQLNLRDAKRGVVFQATFERHVYEAEAGAAGASRARWVVLKRGGVSVSSREEIIRADEATSMPASMPTGNAEQD